MLIIGLLFLRSRVLGVSSFRWRSLVLFFFFFGLHGFLPGRVLFCFLHILYVCSDTLVFFLVYFDFTTIRSYECDVCMFSFSSILYLLAYWDSTWVHLYLISGSVLKVWVVHGDYIDMYDSKEGRRLEFHLYFHHSSFLSFLLGLLDIAQHHSTLIFDY